MKKKFKIHDNACPSCGQRFKRVSGIWRCENCGLNKKYDVDDGRPREGQPIYSTRIKPLISDE